MPGILIWVIMEGVGDGSTSYSVMLPGGATIPGHTKSDAEEMARKMVDAINRHSPQTARVAHG